MVEEYPTYIFAFDWPATCLLVSHGTPALETLTGSPTSPVRYPANSVVVA